MFVMSVQKYGRIKNWFCPFANCKGAFTTRDLIRHLHMKHNLKLPPNVSCESASGCPPMVYLWKNQAGCGFLCLDTMHEVYDIQPCLSSESFAELMAEKAKERSIALKEFHQKIPGYSYLCFFFLNFSCCCFRCIPTKLFDNVARHGR